MAGTPTPVSVIIPTYNRATVLPRTLASVLAQTHPAVEVIVVDDGSTDDTAAVVAAHGGRVRYLRQENRGVEAARRAGLSASTGRYVNFLDDDDLLAPEKLQRQAALLDAHPAMGAVHCRYHFIDADGRWMETTGRLPEGDVLHQLLWGCFPWSGGPLVRRECLEAIGPDEHRDWHGDWGMWLRIALAGYTFGCVQEPLGSYRMLPGSMIDAKIANAERLVFNLLGEVFRRWTFPPAIVAERPQIEAGWRFWIACRYYVGGHWADGGRNLAATLALRPELRDDPAPLLDLFFSDAASPRGRVYDPPRFIADVWEHLPPEAAFLAPYRDTLLARLHAGLALRRFAASNDPASLDEVREAVALDPTVLTRPDAFAAWLAAYARSLPGIPPHVFAGRAVAALPIDDAARRRVRALALADLGVAATAQAAAERAPLAMLRAAVGALRHQPRRTVARGLRRLARLVGVRITAAPR